MGLNANKVPSKGGGDYPPPIDAGTYPARTVMIIDMGVQEQRAYKGEPKPPANELTIVYELLDEFLKDADGEDDPKKPRWQWETIPLHNLSADLAKSTKRYYALDPNAEHEGDWAQLIETPCMVTIIQNTGKDDAVYNNVASVSAMRPKEAQKAPKLVNVPKVLSLDSDDVDTFLSLPQKMQDKIKGGLEWETTELYKALNKGDKKPTLKKKAVVEDDEIPFDDGKVDAADGGDENW